MRFNLPLLLCVLALTACLPPPLMPRTKSRASRLEVQGHRGCRGLRPENTMAAFRHAIALGVDVLELDLGLTSDGVLVVSHDPQVNSVICSAPAPLPSNLLRDLTYAQVRTLDCGSKRNPRFPDQVLAPGERIPRLEMVLDLLRQHLTLRANVEIKTSPGSPEHTHPPARFARTLAPLLRDRSLAGRVVVQSFDPRALKAVAALDGSIPLAALAEKRTDMDPMLQATGARIISPNFSELSREDISNFHQRGVQVIPWTVNETAQMKRLMQWGVDGIITDYPDRLLSLR